MLVLIVILALAFNFVNGFQGAGSSVATVIASRAANPRLALWLSAAAILLGPFLFGIAVAYTIGQGILKPSAVNPGMVSAALISAVAWSLLTWFFAIPSSPSHALVGGLVGTAIASQRLNALVMTGFIKVLLALFLSPILGFVFGLIVTRLVFFLARRASPRINLWFKRGQLLAAVTLALSSGANDGPKGMGIIALGLVASGAATQFQVPLWVILSSALAMSLGTVLGGWRLIKTLGGKFFRIRPVDGFCSQITSTIVILGAALVGGPVSTTQVVSTTILGSGAAERINKVRWGVAGNIALTWLFTIPINIFLAWIIYQLFRQVGLA